MLTMVWNPTGFYLINILSNGIKFNTSYYIADIFVPLLKWRKTQVDGSDGKLIIPADPARRHRARVALEFLKHNGMKRAPRPPYSPDLTPSDSDLLSLQIHHATLGRI
jgi:hypothetical protein